MTTSFTSKDLDMMAQMGTSVSRIEDQIETFRRGVPFTPLVRAATIGDGLIRLDEDQQTPLISLFDQARGLGRVTKFVPASGAASRMFKALHGAREKLAAGTAVDDQQVSTFMANLKRFAFYGEISAILEKNGQSEEDPLAVLNVLLGEMNYASRPKGLLTFHHHEGGTRTPVQEHLAEAAQYAVDAAGDARLHFTVSPEHMDGFKSHVAAATPAFSAAGMNAQITYSVQKTSTNTIAVDPDNNPFRDNRGNLLFRPGGHGALIENLDDLNGDIIFIKNIDNVVPDRLKQPTITYKKALAGLLIRIQDKVFSYLKQLDAAAPTAALCQEIIDFAQANLGIRITAENLPADEAERGVYLHRLLNRPVRVCGMVKNEGEPGGGPFWVNQPDGSQSIQIVETSQIDTTNSEQAAIVNGATHFNPVDLICGVRNYQGQDFALADYVDRNACFLSDKSFEGRPLKALELPGLWNGAMANWNTCFAEVPLITFNPVKTINDLLREQHT